MIDETVSHWLHANAHPVATTLLLGLTWLHNTLGLLLAGFVLCGWLWHRGQRDWLSTLAAALPGAMLLNVLLKQVFRRPRPVFEQPLLELTTYGFPSGHAAGAAALYGFAAMWWLAHRQDRRTLVVGLCAAMVVLVAFSRVYLGVHYLSDVVAGVAFGLLWLLACRAMFRPSGMPP